MASKLKTPIIADLTAEQKKDMEPLFNAGNNVTAYITPKEQRKVITITEDMIKENNNKPFMIRNSWETEKDPLCPLVAGDVLVVSSDNNGGISSYRIGAKEFAGTHKMTGITHKK